MLTVALGVDVGDDSFLDLFAAAICQAGMVADLPSCERGVFTAEGVLWVVVIGACEPCSVGAAAVPLVAVVEAVEDSSAGRDVPGNIDPTGLPGPGEVVPALPPSLLPSKSFRLLSSEPSSLSLFSLPSRAPCSALGIASFNDLTSSFILRTSSSRRRDAVFKSAITFSTSFSVASRRSVRDSSADFSADVSVES